MREPTSSSFASPGGENQFPKYDPRPNLQWCYDYKSCVVILLIMTKAETSFIVDIVGCGDCEVLAC